MEKAFRITYRISSNSSFPFSIPLIVSKYKYTKIEIPCHSKLPLFPGE
jgi:hypothetical protein